MHIYVYIETDRAPHARVQYEANKYSCSTKKKKKTRRKMPRKKKEKRNATDS